MDKSWITKPRNTPEYAIGLEGFLDFAFLHASSNGRIKCPCRDCGFRKMETREVVHDHLMCSQFPPGYTVWMCHGELMMREHQESSNTGHDDLPSHDNIPRHDLMDDMIHDAFGIPRHHGIETLPVLPEPVDEDDGIELEGNHRERGDRNEFADLIRDCNEQLYEGCAKYSKLSFLIKLYHIKCLCRMTDKAMSMILELLQDAFEHARIPSSLYEAKKIINKLGLNYERIDACPNDCMLYWKDDKSRETCKVCGTSRWKNKGNASKPVSSAKKGTKQSAKVLR